MRLYVMTAGHVSTPAHVAIDSPTAAPDPKEPQC